MKIARVEEGKKAEDSKAAVSVANASPESEAETPNDEVFNRFFGQ